MSTRTLTVMHIFLYNGERRTLGHNSLNGLLYFCSVSRLHLRLFFLQTVIDTLSPLAHTGLTCTQAHTLITLLPSAGDHKGLLQKIILHNSVRGVHNKLGRLSLQPHGHKTL